MHHILEAQQFDQKTIEGLFFLAGEMGKAKGSKTLEALRGKILLTLFYEPSTRTRLSFESAMLRLGGQVLSTENAREFSSAAKGETIEDTARVVAGYADVCVIRHYEAGTVKRAAEAVGEGGLHIVNAGDGPGQHPSQALLDLYTIKAELGQIDGLTIGLVGDLLYGRTVHSLSYLLAKFGVKKIYLVAHELVRMKKDILDYFQRHSVSFEEVDDLMQVAGELDVLYQTRIQKERFLDRPEEYDKVKGRYIITPQTLEVMKPDARIMHPLPRVNEIANEVDHDPRAAYFRQAHYGVDMRMALLYTLFNS